MGSVDVFVAVEFDVELEVLFDVLLLLQPLWVGSAVQFRVVVFVVLEDVVLEFVVFEVVVFEFVVLPLVVFEIEEFELLQLVVQFGLVVELVVELVVFGVTAVDCSSERLI